MTTAEAACESTVMCLCGEVKCERTDAHEVHRGGERGDHVWRDGEPLPLAPQHKEEGWNEVDQEEEEVWWRKHHYLAGKEIGDGLWVCLIKKIFTHSLALCDEDFIHEFFCYPDEIAARAWEAYERWDGNGDPIDGWVKSHGPRGERNRSGPVPAM